MTDDLTEAVKKAAELREKTEYDQRLEQRYPRNLHKELLGWRNPDGAPRVQPEDTLYRSWWAFLQAANEHPEVKSEAIGSGADAAARAKKVTEVEQGFGDLGSDFGAWWHRVGTKIFAEGGVPLIHVLKPAPNDEEFKREHGVIMIVPMTISRELLLEQFNLMLDIYHPGKELRRHEHSTAEWKIYPKQRYVEVDYEQLLKIWREKRRNDDRHEADRKPAWEVYCDAVGLDNLKEKLARRDLGEVAKREAGMERIQLGRTFDRLYKQADVLMKNAVLGEFPNDDAFQSKKRGDQG
jgi:hypothetical protein